MNNEVLLKQLVRQMKVMNFWVSFFGTLFIVALVIVGVLLWQVVNFVQATNKNIESMRTNVTNSLDVQKQACEGSSDFSKWLQQQTGVCK